LSDEPTPEVSVVIPLYEEEENVVRVSFELGAVLDKQKRFADAEPVALAAYSAYQTTFGADNATTRALADDLAGIYAALAKPAKAAEWKLRARVK